jgi:hypothetical protein
MAEAMLEGGVTLDPSAVEKVLADSEGRHRLIMDSLAEIERQARRNGWQEISAEMLGGKPLCHDWRVPTRRAAGPAVKKGGA